MHCILKYILEVEDHINEMNRAISPPRHPFNIHDYIDNTGHFPSILGMSLTEFIQNATIIKRTCFIKAKAVFKPDRELYNLAASHGAGMVSYLSFNPK